MDTLSREFAVSSSDQTQRMSFIHAFPGFVNSAWGKDFPFPLNSVVNLMKHLFAMSPEQCGEIMVQNALLGSHMGPPAVPIILLVTENRTVDGDVHKVNAGFHLMSQKGKETPVTKLHHEKYREAVWIHTNEVLRQALLSKA